MTWRPTLLVTPFVVSVVMVTIVLGTVYVDMQDSSPGKLATAHARDARLNQEQSCVLCHGDSQQTMSAACTQCHQDIGDQLNVHSGFHGNMALALVERCEKCHSDHHGLDFQLTSERSFTLAGFPDLQAFQHTWLDFHLVGKHSQLACDRCHQNVRQKVLLKGDKRFQGLSQECTNCHKDVHQASYGNDCASCHGQEHSFQKVAEFIHASDFPLDGAHADPACVDCHQLGTPHGISGLLTSHSVVDSDSQTQRACRTCHASPHQEQFLVAAAQKWNVTAERSCKHCHPSTHHTFLGPLTTVEPAFLEFTGFSLKAPHDKVACGGCHAEYGKRTSDDPTAFHHSYPGRQPDDCLACHGDPHQGQFELGPLQGSNCLNCHDRHAFTPATFTQQQHDRTNFPLVGAHRSVECNSCHRLPMEGHQGQHKVTLASVVRHDESLSRSTLEPPHYAKPDAVRIFHGTPSSCQACHDDPHQGDFKQGPFHQKDCRACHSEYSFQQSEFTIEQHGLTKFPLTGAHQAVACSSCHPRPKVINVPIPVSEGEELDQRSTLLPTFHGTPTRCSSCHADVHAGQFQQSHLPATFDGRAGCARCHTTERFDLVFAATFDHSLWTGYALRGAHAHAKCTDCHARYKPGSDSRTLRRVTKRNCQSCHSDPHVGQFGPTSRVDCTKCHVEGDSFQQLSFNHQRDSRFVLDQQHARLKCSACHQRQRLSDGRTATRYKPLGIQCGDCHVPRGPRQTPSRHPQ